MIHLHDLHLGMMLDKGSSLQIKSPNYPHIYPNNAFNTWIIRAPLEVIISLLLEKVDLRSESDQLFLGTGVDKFTLDLSTCNNWIPLNDYSTPYNIMTYTSVINLIFTSGYGSFGPSRGFSILFSGHRHQGEAANVKGITKFEPVFLGN